MTFIAKNFPTVHCHPQSLDSASTPEAFVKREKELGTGTITCTDHGSMAACLHVYNLAKKNDLTPILGCEFYVRDDDCPILKSFGIPKDAKGTYLEYAKYFHLTAHFLDQAAYEKAGYLLSKADERAERHGAERKPLFGWKELEELGSYNVVYTSSCLIGMVQRHLQQNDRPDIAEAYYQRLKAITKPGNFYAEIFPHVCDNYFQAGVFVTLENGKVHKFYDKKKLKTDHGEIAAAELASEFKKKGNKHTQLEAIKNRTVWEDAGKFEIVSVEKKEEFIRNECTPRFPDGDLQKGCNKFIIELAQKHNDVQVIGDDSHFATPEEKVVQDIRLQASGGSWRFKTSYHRVSGQEAFEHFQSTLGMSEKEFERVVDGCYEWASKFKGLKLEYKPSLPTSFYPQDTFSHLFDLIAKHGRLDVTDKRYVDRLQTEINLLKNNGTLDLLPYFFLAEQVGELYKSNNMLCGPGRGSSGGVLLAYLLGITHIDPIRYDLSLDRFITLDRIRSGKLPDIDTDLPDRDILVDPKTGWLPKVFGNRFAQVSVDTTLKLRSSIKDVARVIHGGKVPLDIEIIAKKLKNAPQGVSDRDFVFGYEAGEEYHQGSIETDEELKKYIAKYPREWKIVQMALGLPRQKSRHASAYVVADRPIEEFIPCTSVTGVRVTQYTAGSVEQAGGIKMDFLSLNSLLDIGECIRQVQQRSGITIPNSLVVNNRQVPGIRLVPYQGGLCDIWDLPDDPEVYKDIVEGRTETVFQFHTDSATGWLALFNHKKPDGTPILNSLQAMSDFTALDRPGPLDAYVTTPEGKKINMLQEYTRRARGLPRSTGIEAFDGLLPETYDILVYQEQVQKIYQYFTGCSGPEAEEFRSDVGKKRKAKILLAYGKFMEAATAKIGKERAQSVWDAIQTFSAYGFCIDGDQAILTLSGPKRMADITGDDQVAYWDGNAVQYEPPSHVLEQGEKEIFEVTLEDGTTIRATADHKFLYQGEWLELQDILKMAHIGLIDNIFETIFGGIEILFVRSIGKRPTFDITMPTKSNFILANGAVAHNCKAHGHEYCIVAYACAFLKHHYPLEWWCAVLRHANKNEVNQEFWSYCGHLIDLPDLQKSGQNFEIQNDRIRAPISLLHGVGEAAHNQLCAHAPYESLWDFCTKIKLHQQLTAKFDPETGKKRTGHNSLNQAVVYTLILAGVMDSLLPETTIGEDGKELHADIVTRLYAYEKTLALASGKSIEKIAIPDQYTSVDSLIQYQIRKNALPAYSQNIWGYLVNRKQANFHQDGNGFVYKWRDNYYAVRTGVDVNYFTDLPEDNLRSHIPLKVALVGYVLTQRVFGYKKEGKDKEACEFVLEADGAQIKMVRWGNSKTGLVEERHKAPLEGAIVIALLSKRDERSSFFLEDLVVVQKPFEGKSKKEKE